VEGGDASAFDFRNGDRHTLQLGSSKAHVNRNPASSSCIVIDFAATKSEDEAHAHLYIQV
jgi:hypothetical protein